MNPTVRYRRTGHRRRPRAASCAYHLAAQALKSRYSTISRSRAIKYAAISVGPVAIRELAGMGIDQYEAFRKTNVITQAALYLDGKAMITKEHSKGERHTGPWPRGTAPGAG